MKAGIIDSLNKFDFWNSSIGEAFDFVVAADISELSECDVLLISEEYCGGAIGTVMENIRASEKLGRIPAAAVTYERSCEDQEILFGLGFDDIILLPACPQLLQCRVLSLSKITPSFCSDRRISIDSLMRIKDGECGAYYVCTDDFENIYRFVLRILERTKKNAQVLVLTLEDSRNCDAMACRSEIDTLTNAVKLCLRRGDMATVCGDNRMLVLLIGADDEGGHLVANRIVSSFYSECDDSDLELTYDIRAVRA
jgi:hypothetical protein